jgi:hypothetical protein
MWRKEEGMQIGKKSSDKTEFEKSVDTTKNIWTCKNEWIKEGFRKRHERDF